ncbi:hypothetical protein SpiBuddy_2377 [Sphaerochaeta globosa str. Buddy]|uniref:Uncharacterized protein n=2 Tax=Sphaerochaeta TaxID=399320 RepID=F0RRE0_SPHGB|nr:hypothetical protein SpiBuddy_2377 [Sphaerochaeta globosa str. Buddy]
MDWIPTILELCESEYGKGLVRIVGSICDYSLQKKPYTDPIQKQLGMNSIDLENCFEFSLSPPVRFLEWLIQNPLLMKWPNGKKYSEQTEYKRRKLFNNDSTTIAEALELLRNNQVRNPNRDWWVFEGFTEVDCLIETENIVLAIEGKRTEEGPSQSVDWYPQRNQLVRNLEALKQYVKDKEYALILIDEEGKYKLEETMFTASLPHLSLEERVELRRHYLGNITWKQVCIATGINYSELPNTIDDIVR